MKKRSYINFTNTYSFKLTEEELTKNGDLFITIRPEAHARKYILQRRYEIHLEHRPVFEAIMISIKPIRREDITSGMAWADARVTAAKLENDLTRRYRRTLGPDYDNYVLITLKRKKARD